MPDAKTAMSKALKRPDKNAMDGAGHILNLLSSEVRCGKRSEPKCAPP
jgi:hypothetical protein